MVHMTYPNDASNTWSTSGSASDSRQRPRVPFSVAEVSEGEGMV
jgi:hypothetical protein